jgi:hypothetical protein
MRGSLLFLLPTPHEVQMRPWGYFGIKKKGELKML